MKKLLVIFVIAILFCSNTFANDYFCVDENGEPSNLIRSNNTYEFIIRNESWIHHIYEETKELLVLGKVSNAEGMHKPEIEDGIAIIIFSKIYNTGMLLFYENKGDIKYKLEFKCTLMSD